MPARTRGHGAVHITEPGGQSGRPREPDRGPNECSHRRPQQLLSREHPDRGPVCLAAFLRYGLHAGSVRGRPIRGQGTIRS